MDKLRTFVVEDSPVILRSLTEALEESADVEVVGSAADESSAVAWLGAPGRCDVVIVDVFLRSGSGLGVLKAMRRYAPPPERVVLTNYATSDVRSRCRALGADVVFDKSNEVEEMLAWFVNHRRRPH